MITVVDYGMGNLGSVLNMLRYVGAEAEATGDVQKIAAATRLILPGVGAFDAAMERINTTPGLREVLDCKALGERIPVLGICLGMQLLTESSAEGSLLGLGWIRGNASRLAPPQGSNLKVPHMGWNIAQPTETGTAHPLWAGLEADARFYFVHSYCVEAKDRAAVLATAHHGQTFDAVIATGNIAGAQFHPERSHRAGKRLLENFARWGGLGRMNNEG